MIHSPQIALNPAFYHGHGKTGPFFEGWYYKLVSKDEQHRYAIIPGVFIANNMTNNTTETHSFIQVLNGTTGETAYHKYGILTAARDAFDVQIDHNRFQEDCITLNIDEEEGSVQGELRFENLKPWPVTSVSVGYMGLLGWLSEMECNHGVLSFDHEIHGALTINGERIDFTGGRGYIEKDWGKSFPSAYVWMQSNHFDVEGVSLSASVAVVPGLTETFRGFGIGLLVNDDLYTFMSYNNTKIDVLHVSDEEVAWVLYKKDIELKIRAHRSTAGLLKGPQRTGMSIPVHESITSTIDVTLSALSSARRTVLFEGTGRNAGLEVVGDMKEIVTT